MLKQTSALFFFSFVTKNDINNNKNPVKTQTITKKNEHKHFDKIKTAVIRKVSSVLLPVFVSAHHIYKEIYIYI